MIVKATHKVRGRLMLALLCAVLSCLSQQAHALVEGNLNCTVPGFPSGGYTFTPGQAIRIVYEGTCTVRRAFPYSAGLNSQVNYLSGPDQAPLRLTDPYHNIYLSNLPIGQYSNN